MEPQHNSPTQYSEEHRAHLTTSQKTCFTKKEANTSRPCPHSSRCRCMWCMWQRTGVCGLCVNERQKEFPLLPWLQYSVPCPHRSGLAKVEILVGEWTGLGYYTVWQTRTHLSISLIQRPFTKKAGLPVLTSVPCQVWLITTVSERKLGFRSFTYRLSSTKNPSSSSHNLCYVCSLGSVRIPLPVIWPLPSSHPLVHPPLTVLFTFSLFSAFFFHV